MVCDETVSADVASRQLAGFAAVVGWTSTYGLREVAISVAAYQVVLVVAQFVYLESRQVGIPLRATWEALVPGFVASGVGLAVAYPTVRLLSPEVGHVAPVRAGGAFTVGPYALVLRVVLPASWFTVVLLVALARPGAGRAAADIQATPAGRVPDAPETARRW